MASDIANHLSKPAVPSRIAPERSMVGEWSGNLLGIIGRIEEAVDAETAAIRTDAGFDIKLSNARKSRFLYELSMATKGLNPNDLRDEHRVSLLRLREKLATNEAAIRAHLSAVNEVAALLQQAIQGAEADGTYSSAEFGRTAQT